jgi:soluble lytic murein transglycosylase-like protein
MEWRKRSGSCGRRWRARLDDAGFVPARFAPMISRAAQRWSVSAALLAAQLYAESNFNPFARSRVGALGIAQFMPGTAAGLGLDNPFDAERAIDA